MEPELVSPTMPEQQLVVDECARCGEVKAGKFDLRPNKFDFPTPTAKTVFYCEDCWREVAPNELGNTFSGNAFKGAVDGKAEPAPEPEPEPEVNKL